MAPVDNRRIMLTVCACLLPGLAAQMALFGSGVGQNLLITTSIALVTEAGCLRLMQRPVSNPITDGSSLVTALILAAALPPACGWPVVAVATVAAVGIGKYAYGGLGNNLFNPAMVGYAVALISFPAALAVWPSHTDALSGATALTALRFRGGQTIEDLWLTENGFGTLGPTGWEWINAAYLLGGAVLILMRLAAWRASAGMLLALGLLAAITWDNGSSASQGSPLFHWLAGGTLLAAFFVVTDPVSHPTSHRGQWLFGLLVGSITFVIRAFGNYPDGIAFAVLLANATTPYLDRRLAGVESGHG